MFTLGVRDFDKQRNFYRRLGWPLVFDSDDFAVFELRGAVLALFPVEKAGGRQQRHARGRPRRHPLQHHHERRGTGRSRLGRRASPRGRRHLPKEPTDAEFFEGSMPCDGEWTEEQVELFQRWTETGMLE
jgi:uncharacterized protein